MNKNIGLKGMGKIKMPSIDKSWYSIFKSNRINILITMRMIA